MTSSRRTSGCPGVEQAASGPSGVTADHLDHCWTAKSTLPVSGDSPNLAWATVPDEIVDVVRLGCMIALCKPNGGVQGIVAGDMVCRLVARTISQQISKAVEQATAGDVPFPICSFD